jgi:hypothetical protein
MLAIIKLAAVLAVIVFLLLKLRLNLGLALLGGSALAGALFAIAPPRLVEVIFWKVVSADGICFILLVVFIVLLSYLMEKSGHLQRVVDRVGDVVGSGRRRLAALPAIIGMLPMPGGAIFSAPMVHAASGEMDLEPARKVAINHWFRHIWEFCWPLYPGVIAYQEQLAGINLTLAQVIPFQIPLTVMMAAIGFAVLFPRGMKKAALERSERSWGERLWRLIIIGMPIVIVVAIFAGLQAPANMLQGAVGFESAEATKQARTLIARLPLLIGLVVSIVYVVKANAVPLRDVGAFFLKSGKAWSMTLMVIGIVAFDGVVSESGGGGQSAEFFRRHGLEFFVIVGVPFIIAMVTGITVAFVSISFPLLIPVVAGMEDPHKIPYMVLAFAMGFVAMLLSPVHLCLVLGREYFGAGARATYRFLAKPSVLLVGAAVGLFFLLRLVGV